MRLNYEPASAGVGCGHGLGWDAQLPGGQDHLWVSYFFTLVTGPRGSLSLKLSDTIVYAPQIWVSYLTL